MILRFALAAAALLLAPAAALAQPAPATVKVALDTSVGPIVLALETERAPATAANFLAYVDQKRFDGIVFYRATKVGEGYGLIQGGLQNDPARLLPPIPHEPTSATGLSHVDGAISMAMLQPGTAQAEFFITIGDLVSMDAQAGNPGFAVFGRVVEGMDAVRRILAAPTDPNQGDGAMKGQMIAAPIRVTTARRVE